MQGNVKLQDDILFSFSPFPHTVFCNYGSCASWRCCLVFLALRFTFNSSQMVLATESIKAKNKCLNGKHLLAEKYLGKGILSFVKPEMEKKKNLVK